MEVFTLQGRQAGEKHPVEVNIPVILHHQVITFGLQGDALFGAQFHHIHSSDVNAVVRQVHDRIGAIRGGPNAEHIVVDQVSVSICVQKYFVFHLYDFLFGVVVDEAPGHHIVKQAFDVFNAEFRVEALSYVSRRKCLYAPVVIVHHLQNSDRVH